MGNRDLLTSPRAERAFAFVQRFLKPPPLLAVLSGPAGVGKDATVQRVRDLGYPFHFVVTTTDRAPRPGEVDGVDYCFVSTPEFERLIADDELIEYARVYDQYKGVPKTHVRQALASGQDVLMRLDVQGAATVKAKFPETLTIFLAPPSAEVLAHRLERRGGDSEAQVRRRLETALKEMSLINDFDYVIVNHEGQLDETAKQAIAVMMAEHCRTDRRRLEI